VPAFIAAVYVMNYYDKHGLHPVQINLPIRSDTVMLDRDVLFTYVCQATGLEMDELRSLNPQYRVDYIPASTEPYSLCLPMGKIEAFLQMQDSVYAQSRDSLNRKPVKVEPRAASGGSGGSGGSKYYTVRKGDTLSKIASKHGISVSTLKKRNGLRGDKIRVGQKLKIR
jgi:membrane-bound lytic murein transglycosylase D